MSGLIYYIFSQESARVKIGYTTGNPMKRLRALQTGSPTKLALLAVHPGTMDQERILHERFAEDCEHGEWFNVTDELIDHASTIAILMAFVAADRGEKPDPWVKVACQAIFQEEGIPEELAAML